MRARVLSQQVLPTLGMLVGMIGCADIPNDENKDLDEDQTVLAESFLSDDYELSDENHSQVDASSEDYFTPDLLEQNASASETIERAAAPEELMQDTDYQALMKRLDRLERQITVYTQRQEKGEASYQRMIERYQSQNFNSKYLERRIKRQEKKLLKIEEKLKFLAEREAIVLSEMTGMEEAFIAQNAPPSVEVPPTIIEIPEELAARTEGDGDEVIITGELSLGDGGILVTGLNSGPLLDLDLSQPITESVVLLDNGGELTVNPGNGTLELVDPLEDTSADTRLEDTLDYIAYGLPDQLTIQQLQDQAQNEGKWVQDMITSLPAADGVATSPAMGSHLALDDNGNLDPESAPETTTLRYQVPETVLGEIAILAPTENSASTIVIHEIENFDNNWLEIEGTCPPGQLPVHSATDGGIICVDTNTTVLQLDTSLSNTVQLEELALP